jgi:hypothetical protein
MSIHGFAIQAEEGRGTMKKPAKHTAPDWTEMYRLERGIDPSDRHQLLNAVTKDITVARHGDTAAKRRVAAYIRAQRAFDRQVATPALAGAVC